MTAGVLEMENEELAWVKWRKRVAGMNYLWAGMILIGVVYAAFTGRLPDVITAAIDSAKEAVTLCITMLGVMSFGWV